MLSVIFNISIGAQSTELYCKSSNHTGASFSGLAPYINHTEIINIMYNPPTSISGKPYNNSEF